MPQEALLGVAPTYPTYMHNKTIRKYTYRDYKMIASWYAARGKKPPPPGVLSDMGYIADERVAGFLYLTNSNLAMVEGIISNPYTVPSYRRQSLLKLSSFLVDTALLLGYTNIFGIGLHPSMAKVANQLGFQQSDYKVWTLNEKE